MNANIGTQIDDKPWCSLSAIKQNVIEEMSTFKHDVPRLRALNDWLRRELDLETKYQGLLSEVSELIAERQAPLAQRVINNGQRQSGSTSHTTNQNQTDESYPFGIGRKARARQCRLAYLARERKLGRNLVLVRSAYYRNDTGQIVGITFSSEKKDKNGVWFLNLKDGEFQEAVLLCAIGHETFQPIHLSKSFLDRYGRHLSRDQKGQVKFNVTRSHGTFSLQIPEPIGFLDLAEYVEGDPVVCPDKIHK